MGRMIRHHPRVDQPERAGADPAKPLTTEPLEPEPLPPLPSILRLLARSLRQNAWRFLATRATTVRGQVAGCLLLLVPAMAHPLPLPSVVQILAVLAGSTGAVMVFGGLVIRAVLQPAPWGSESRVTDEPVPLSQALLSVPHHRAVWAALLLLCHLMASGAAWYLIQAFSGDAAGNLANALLLGLPALALGWAVWQARVMRSTPQVTPH
jgi:hypothetical protein